MNSPHQVLELFLITETTLLHDVWGKTLFYSVSDGNNIISWCMGRKQHYSIVYEV